MSDIRDDVHEILERLRDRGSHDAASTLQEVAGLLWARETECKAKDAEIARLRERVRVLMLALDRLVSAASEQQHTLQSKGWNERVDDFRFNQGRRHWKSVKQHLKWSVAGALKDQYDAVSEALEDAAKAMEDKCPPTT